MMSRPARKTSGSRVMASGSAASTGLTGGGGAAPVRSASICASRAWSTVTVAPYQGPSSDSVSAMKRVVSCHGPLAALAHDAPQQRGMLEAER